VVNEVPFEIPKQYYQDICNMLMVTGGDWKNLSVWEKIEANVKHLCKKAGVEEHEIRNWLRTVWPNIERLYEEKMLREKQEKIESERNLLQEKDRQQRADIRHKRHIEQLRHWLEQFLDEKWDLDQWDDFVSLLDHPVDTNKLEYLRDNAIVNYDKHSVKDVYTGLIWHKNPDLLTNLTNSEDPNEICGIVNKLRQDFLYGYDTWRLPSSSELFLYNKKAALWGLPKNHKLCFVRKLNKINVEENGHTLIDCSLGVEWIIKKNGESYKNLSYYDSLQYLQDLSESSYLGYANWRLPTRYEFEGLLEYYAIEYLSDFEEHDYWMSSNHDNEHQCVMSVIKPTFKKFFVTPKLEFTTKTKPKAVLNRVWPVRSIG
jgi:hypothetical protein